MWAFLKAILIPVLIVGVGVQYLYCHIFTPLSRHHIRKKRCYHTHCRIDRHRDRANKNQGNDVILRGRPKHEPNSKSSDYFNFIQRETHLQSELRSSQPPTNPPRPRTSKRKEGWERESIDKV
jgi:hypothetical protein